MYFSLSRPIWNKAPHVRCLPQIGDIYLCLYHILYMLHLAGLCIKEQWNCYLYHTTKTKLALPCMYRTKVSLPSKIICVLSILSPLHHSRSLSLS